LVKKSHFKDPKNEKSEHFLACAKVSPADSDAAKKLNTKCSIVKGLTSNDEKKSKETWGLELKDL